MATLMPEGKQSFTNSAGAPLAGGKLYTYDAGTNNPRTTYQDAAATVPNTNPVIMDARGEATVFWSGAYKVVLKDAADVTIWTVDNVMDPATAATAYTDALRADLADAVTAGKGTTLLGYVRAAASAVATTLKAWLNWQSVNVFEFMTVAQIADVQARSLTLDTTAAFTAAVAVAITGGRKKIVVPSGAYLLNGGAAAPDGFKNGVLVPYTGSVNFDPEFGITIEAEGSGTTLYCGSDNMILIRNSRNCTTIRNITLNANGKANVWGLGIVPEDMTQVITQVSNSFCTTYNLQRVGAFTEGIVIMPGPTVGGADSGCFYHNFFGGMGNLVGGKRHVWFRKNVDWAAHPNRPTRTAFFGERLVRGNTGYYFEVGSEIDLVSCNEELIATGVLPLATPTARYVSADCTNINWENGYSEACSKSADVLASNIVNSFGYIPASGSDTTFTSNVSSYEDGINDDRVFTPVVTSSGGGAQGAATSTGRVTKHGKLAFITVQISAAKGTLAAGNITITGLPYVADPNWAGAGLQWMQGFGMNGTTLGANFTQLGAFITGASLTVRKMHTQGGTTAALTVADCADPIVFTLQGFYKVA